MIYYLNNKPGNPLVIEIITPSRGTLRLSPLFKKALKEQAGEQAEEWKKDLDKATLLIKCIQQRNNTMRQLMEQLAAIQKSYIIHGDVHLQSLTRAEIADTLGVHESTISRAVANKTVQLPNKKIIPMATFFDRSLAVRAILRNIVENEKPCHERHRTLRLTGRTRDQRRPPNSRKISVDGRHLARPST